MARRQQTRGMDDIPYVQGAIYGAIAFVVGYLITLAVVTTQEAEDLTENLIETSGWLYYNAQFADVEFSAMGQSETINYVTEQSSQLDAPAILYHLIPVVVLIAAGFLLAKNVNAQTTQDGAIAGATMVAGTAVLAIVGTFIFEVSAAGASGSPKLLTGVLLVGIVFPAVLGAAGGALGSQS